MKLHTPRRAEIGILASSVHVGQVTIEGKPQITIGMDLQPFPDLPPMHAAGILPSHVAREFAAALIDRADALDALDRPESFEVSEDEFAEMFRKLSGDALPNPFEDPEETRPVPSNVRPFRSPLNGGESNR